MHRDEQHVRIFVAFARPKWRNPPIIVLNFMFARLGMDYEIRNQCFFAILEALTTD